MAFDPQYYANLHDEIVLLPNHMFTSMTEYAAVDLRGLRENVASK